MGATHDLVSTVDLENTVVFCVGHSHDIQFAAKEYFDFDSAKKLIKFWQGLNNNNRQPSSIALKAGVC